MHKFVKKGLAVALGCAVMMSVAGCVTTEEVDEEGAALTLETLEGWCDYSGTAFLNAYRMRDVDAMDDYIANGMVDSFDDAYDQFFDVQSRKVWLEDFYVNDKLMLTLFFLALVWILENYLNILFLLNFFL